MFNVVLNCVNNKRLLIKRKIMNKDIFNLIENPNDLPSSNQGMAEMFYREVLPTRNVSDSATSNIYNSQFGGTNISIRWNLDNRTWWLPARSYIKLDLEITKPGDGSEPLEIADKIAPNMGLAPSLFNRLSFKMNDTTVSQISQYIPQCDALAKRVYNSENWMGKAEGDSAELWNAYQKKRLNDITEDGLISDYYIGNAEQLNENTFIELDRTDIGLGISRIQDTSSFVISATQIVTIAALGNFELPDLRNVLKIGDIIKLNASTAGNAAEVFTRTFIVDTFVDATHMRLMNLNGTALAAAVGSALNGVYNLKILRLQQDVKVLQKLEAVQANAATLAISLLNVGTVAAGSYNNDKLAGGDIITRQLAANADDIIGFLNVNKINNSTTFQGATGYDLAGAIAAANVDVRIFKYSDVMEFTSGANMGYTSLPVQNLSHAWALAAGLPGVTFTQSTNGALTVVPNVNLNWKVNDIIVLASQPGNYYYYLVTQVDITGDGNQMYLSTSQNIAGALGDVADGRNYVVGRYRYNPQEEPQRDIINIAKNKSKFDVCWKPSCLSIFNYPGAIPGGCKFELELQALAQEYIGLCVETPFGIKKSGRISSSIDGIDYQVLVKNLKLYICQVQGPVVGNEEYSYYINMNELRAHTRQLQSKSLVQTSLDVTPSSYALALAFQDNRANNREDTDISVTKFHVTGENSDREELSLERYSIRFAGLSVPQPDAEIKNGDLQEFLCNQYIRNQIYTNQYFRNSGGESIQEWKERGIYFYHPFIRSAGNREVRAYVMTQFNESDESKIQLSDDGLDNLQLFLFEFYRAFALIKMRNGFVYSIQTANQ